MPEKLGPEELSAAQAALERSGWAQHYHALERLFLGWLIHGCWTMVVLLSLRRPRRGFLLLAMLWHFAHDMSSGRLELASQDPSADDTRLSGRASSTISASSSWKTPSMTSHESLNLIDPVLDGLE